MAFDLPETLTPSKIGRFMQCPMSFRYSYIDRIAEPPTLPQFRGTLVHRVLQLLFSVDKKERSLPRAQQALKDAWDEVKGSDELTGLALDEQAEQRLLGEADGLLAHYFELEEPSSVNAIGIELDLRSPLGAITMRGIIDRLDELPDGSLVVTDYKTGRAPRQEFARTSMIGVQFYAHLCEQIYGRRPREVRLMYLKDRIVVVESPTDQTQRGLRQRATAVWGAIERACASEDFRPNPSRLCNYCAYQSICPAMVVRAEPLALSR